MTTNLAFAKLVFAILTIVSLIFLVYNNLILEKWKSLQNLPLCYPKKNIAFIKTHKTGSTSVQNILLRYGYKNNAVFVLPKMQGNVISQKYLLHRSLVWPSSHEMNILAHHARFNLKEVKSIMPGDTIFVTLLRNAVSAFESLYDYFDLKTLYSVAFENFTSTSKIANLKGRKYGFAGVNQMLFDLGFKGTPRGYWEVEQFLMKLESQFDLVMIAEHMDESLILLKDLICSTTEDMVTFKLNARHITHEISPSIGKMVRSVNWADDLLYQHFSNILQKKMESFGHRRLQEQVDQLRKRRKYLFNQCVRALDKTRKVVNLEVKEPESELCWLMTRTESQLTDFIRDKQEKRFKIYAKTRI